MPSFDWAGLLSFVQLPTLQHFLCPNPCSSPFHTLFLLSSVLTHITFTSQVEELLEAALADPEAEGEGEAAGPSDVMMMNEEVSSGPVPTCASKIR